MRLLFIILLAALAVGCYEVNSQKGKASSQGILGKALLRRALEAMSNSPQINVKRRSLEEDNSGDKIKHTDAIEDIFVGTGSRSEDRGESLGARRSGANKDKEKENQSDTEPDQSGENDSDTESSGDDGTQTNEQNQELEKNQSTVETESPADQSEAQPSDEENPEDQSEDTRVSSGNADTVETPSEGQSTSTATASSETSEDTESSNTERAQETSNSEHDKSTAVSTMEVAKNDKTEQEAKENKSDNETDSEETKKSTIAKVPSISRGKELAETQISSGESDEVTSGTGEATPGAEVTSEESSGVEDDGSAEAIRKGMESLSKLLKPVANGVDFQLFSGAAKTEDAEVEEDEKERSESKAEGKGESDKPEEIEQQKPHVVKLKKCETKCTLPMSYDQCAVPRCDLKVGTIKDLCVWLCKHQKPVCKKECKEVE